jgi:putative addiction module component (TIGR02574 family)
LLWGSIGSSPGIDALPVTPAQRDELDRRVAEDMDDGDPGLPVDDVIADLRRRIWPGD